MASWAWTQIGVYTGTSDFGAHEAVGGAPHKEPIQEQLAQRAVPDRGDKRTTTYRCATGGPSRNWWHSKSGSHDPRIAEAHDLLNGSGGDGLCPRLICLPDFDLSVARCSQRRMNGDDGQHYNEFHDIFSLHLLATKVSTEHRIKGP
jgi:hypothetical protein